MLSGCSSVCVGACWPTCLRFVQGRAALPFLDALWSSTFRCLGYGRQLHIDFDVPVSLLPHAPTGLLVEASACLLLQCVEACVLPLLHYACLGRSTKVPEGVGKRMGHFLFYVTVTSVYILPLHLRFAGSLLCIPHHPAVAWCCGTHVAARQTSAVTLPWEWCEMRRAGSMLQRT